MPESELTRNLLDITSAELNICRKYFNYMIYVE